MSAPPEQPDPPAHPDRDPGSGRRRAAVAAVALAATVLAAVLVFAAVGRDDADPSDSDQAGATSTTAAPADDDEEEATRPPTSDPAPTSTDPPPVTVPVPADGYADPSVDDVVDPAFPGLGDPRVDVVHYDLRVSADMGSPTITGRAVLSLAALTADPLPELTLDLAGPMVTSVEVDGTEAEFDQVDREVLVTPSTPLEPLEVVDVVVAYEGVPEAREQASLGTPIGWQPDDEGGWFTLSEPVGTSTWAPVSDHPSDKATWRITIDTEAGITGVSNGRLVDRRDAAGRTEWTWEQDRPMATYLALAAVGRYELVTRPGPGGVELLFAFPASLPPADRTGFDQVEAIMALFSEEFGSYPDDDGGAIVVPARFDMALETQTRPTFSRHWVSPGHVDALAHEIAHEWFGNAVTPERWIDLWLNEGFATYAELMWRVHSEGGDLTALVEDDEDRLFASDLAPRSVEAASEFDLAVYGNGARALHALRLEVGDLAFRTILRRWFTDRSGSVAGTDDFTALAEEVSGRDLDDFFRRWLDEGGYHPLPR